MSLLLKNIRKSYRQPNGNLIPVLGIDQFQMAQGEQVALLGSSGGGKTTLLNIISGILVPDSGEVIVDGKNIAAMSEVVRDRFRASKIGIVFQTFNLLPRLTTLENVALPLIYAGMSKSQRTELAEETLEAVGLGDRMTHKPNELSGGQRQRVAIARALVNHPSIILADEPTGNLDTKTSLEIMAIFDDLHAAGNTIILVTHEPDIAEYAHRIVRLRDGLIETDEKNMRKVAQPS